MIPKIAKERNEKQQEWRERIKRDKFHGMKDIPKAIHLISLN